ncbi:tRNA pseudouridine(38-40) synthase TruA [Devriesea agamarum]|uniref:tRNA pseudouridine(38-40) synthase TruA n=1 Tax=Devriesea agamarum TaxID=472569 RepID=UPI00071E2F86|nr:tRNA pseudouridine(38-40) synthase TruA [Devriesea agamarum]
MSYRVRLDLAYDGTAFHGWARQPGQRTVQGALEAALSTVMRSEVSVTVAGRTDAGVHARGQVAHLDVDPEAWEALPGRSDRTPGDALLGRLIALLPADIAVQRARRVPDEFDARFAALHRTYRYRICDRVERRDPMRRDVLWHRRPLDVEAMQNSAQALLGEHDFLSFCRPREGASTIRTLIDLFWERPHEGHADAGLVVATVRADAFCHHMVRSLVGAALAVGEGRRPVSWPRELLEACTRESSGAAPMAPATGLTLESVVYPPVGMLADQVRAARTRRGPTDTTI